MACRKKYKALILKEVPCISKYMACIFRLFKCLKNNILQKPQNDRGFCPFLQAFRLLKPV